jgi:hypothetical protein
MNLKSLIVKMARRASNKACELQPAQTDGLVLGFATFQICHELCKRSKVHASFETSHTLER